MELLTPTRVWLLRLVAVVIIGASSSETSLLLAQSTATDWFTSGMAKQGRGDLNGAIADYNRAIELDPSIAAAFNNRGNVKQAKGDLNGAIADFNRAIEIDGKHVDPYYNLGNAMQAKGDLDGAILEFNQAIRVDPRYAPAYYNRAYAQQLKGNSFEAFGDYSRAIALASGDSSTPMRSLAARALINRGNLQVKGGDLDGALADFTHAIELDPKSPAAYCDRGSVKIAKGEIDVALRDLNRAIELDPKFAPAYDKRGKARFMEGQYSLAATDFAKVQQLLGPNAYIAISLYLARARAGAEGASAELIANVESVKAEDWPSPLIQFFVGEIDIEKLNEMAASPDSKVTKEHRCETNYLVGEWRMLMHQQDEARSMFQQAERECPRYSDSYNGAVAELKRI